MGVTIPPGGGRGLRKISLSVSVKLLLGGEKIFQKNRRGRKGVWGVSIGRRSVKTIYISWEKSSMLPSLVSMPRGFHYSIGGDI